MLAYIHQLFQSLTGRLKTDNTPAWVKEVAIEFQSLTGRLKTEFTLEESFPHCLVSIPHR